MRDKTIGTVMIFTAFGIIGGLVLAGFGISRQWESEIGTHWTMAERAATIPQKAEHIDKFVAALEKAGLEGVNDALLFPTPTTSFESNFAAVKSLQSRLNELKDQDPNTTQYQMAIQQITGQEQGEAGEVISTLNGCWLKENHYFFWNPILVLTVALLAIALAIMGAAVIES